MTEKPEVKAAIPAGKYPASDWTGRTVNPSSHFGGGLTGGRTPEKQLTLKKL